LTEVRHYVNSTEQLNQRLDYFYDSDYTGLSSYGWGRLSEVTFGNGNASSQAHFAYLYSYSQAGRITTQRMRYYPVHPDANATVDLDATYQWDNEGKMTFLTYPPWGMGGGIPPKYSYTYDLMGRLTNMYEPGCIGYIPPSAPSGTASPAAP